MHQPQQGLRHVCVQVLPHGRGLSLGLTTFAAVRLSDLSNRRIRATVQPPAWL